MKGIIYHIYPGTSGGQGLYIDEIYRTLKSLGYTQRAFVSYYYPFDYADKIYCKRSAIGQSKLSNRLRRMVMLFETLKAHIEVIWHAKRDKPEIINYSHTGSSYSFIVWFLRKLKKVSGAKIVVTCHDVYKVTDSEVENNNRKRIFETADYLLVHTEQSINELQHNWDIDASKIFRHRFPIMDMTRLALQSETNNVQCDFLYIGNLSVPKGVNVLLSGWPQMHEKYPNATLRVCGRKLPGVDFNQSALERMNVDFNLKYIDDADYIGYIRSARYVIMPHIKGTNSGIISTVLSLGANVITSNIPMFRENPIIPSENMFESGNIESMIEVMGRLYNTQPIDTKALLDDYRVQFSLEINRVYINLQNKK